MTMPRDREPVPPAPAPGPGPGPADRAQRDGGSPGRAWLTGGALGALLFVAVFVGESLVHPPGYDPLRHTVSGFVLGPLGWVQRVNFVVSGGLLALSVLGLWPVWRRRGGGRAVPVLVGLIGLGLVGAGIFATDPVAAGITAAAPYPVGAPVPTGRTLTGVLHDLCGVPVFLGLPVVGAAAGWRFWRWGRRGWAAYSIGSAVAFAAGFVLTGLALAQPPVLPPVGGLLQRLTLVIGCGWLAALLLALRRHPSPESATGRR